MDLGALERVRSRALVDGSQKSTESNIDKVRSCKKMAVMITSTNKFLLVLVVWASLAASCRLVAAQYGATGGYNYGGQSHMSSGGQEEFEGPEDRPKVRLGIRLRIPAFKFELPRFSLPKITVQAKIRQPDGPRVIRLPEINFDTSSKVEPPGGGDDGKTTGGSGGYSSSSAYQASPSYSMASYGAGDAGKSNTFTFSTGEETSAPEQPAANYGTSARYQHANQYRPPSPASVLAANKMNNYYHTATMRQHQQQARYQQPQMSMQRQPALNTYGSYGSVTTSAHPRYSMYNMPPGGVGDQSAYQYRVEEEGASVPSANPDLGFNSPATSRRA